MACMHVGSGNVVMMMLMIWKERDMISDAAHAVGVAIRTYIHIYLVIVVDVELEAKGAVLYIAELKK